MLKALEYRPIGEPMIPLQTISAEEFDELDAFLLSDNTPEECMDISTLDGFLTGLVIGPENVMPSQWLPIALGYANDDSFVWPSPEKMDSILNIIIRYFNTIAGIFDRDPLSFEPIFYQNPEGEPIMDEWCFGFMTAVFLHPGLWKRLMSTEDDEFLMAPIVLFGTDQGWEALEREKFRDISQEKWAESIEEAVQKVHQYWLPYRQTKVAELAKSTKKIGRNDPCPCGSGKKFKNCCMN